MARRVSAVAVAALAAAAVVAAGCRAPYTRDLEVLKARQARADLNFAVEQAQAIHANLYHGVSEAGFRRAVDRANGQIHDRMERRELQLVMMELMATVGDDHTYVDGTVYGDFLGGGGRTLPVRLAYDGPAKARVEAVSPECAAKYVRVGAVVTAIDGVGIDEWVARYRKYVSQEDARQRDARTVKELAELLWLDRGARAAFDLRGVDADGREWAERVPAVRQWETDPNHGGGGDPFPFAFYRGGDVCVLTTRSFWYELAPQWEKSVAAMLDEMGKKGTKLFVLDLRHNGGGDSALGTNLLQRIVDRPFGAGAKDWRYSRAYQLACLRWGIWKRGIPSWLYLEYFVHLDRYMPNGVPLEHLQGEWIRLPQGSAAPIPGGPWHGKLAVLVDGRTGSSAVDVAAMVKDNGLGLIAGEETGGRASFYCEIAPVGLPHSGIYCLVASAYHTRPAGYDDGRGVLPDVPLEPGMPDEKVVAVLWERLQSGKWPATRPATRPATSKIDTPVR